MNYYPHHIGDFRSGTINMTRLERWIYRDLIDVYYDTETPLSLDLDAACYAVGASGDDERRAVANLMRFKFAKTAEGYVHERCEIEIAAYRLKAETAQENGKKGGRPKKLATTGSDTKQNPFETQEKPIGFSPGSHPDTSRYPDITGSKTNQEPITNNQEPGTKEKKKRAVVDGFDPLARLIEIGVSQQVAQDWLEHRKAKKATVTATVLDQHEAQAAIAGCSLQDALAMACARGWTGFEAEWLANAKQAQKPGNQPFATAAQRRQAESDANMRAFLGEPSLTEPDVQSSDPFTIDMPF